MIYYIYSLRNIIDNEIYIGSVKHYDRYQSVQAILNVRLSVHKRDSVRDPNRRVYIHLNKIGWENVHIKLEHVINTDLWSESMTHDEVKNSVRRIEGFYICRRGATLNSEIAGRTRLEYQKECQMEYHKEFNRRKVACPTCNQRVNYSCLLRHQRRKHLHN